MEVNYLGAIKILQNYLPQLRNTEKNRNSLIRVCMGKDRIFRLETTQILILGFSTRPHLCPDNRSTTLIARSDTNDNEEIPHERTGNSVFLYPRRTTDRQVSVDSFRRHLGTPRRSGARRTVFDGRPSCLALARCSDGALVVVQIKKRIL